MEKMGKGAATVAEYIAQFPPEVQQILNTLRKMVNEIAPEAEERISYGMPGYYYHGPLVYFAAHRNHIGFYPTPSGIEAFEKELAEYRNAKGSVQFPYKKPMPYDLMRRIIEYRLAENLQNKKKA
ncbi:MAG TPA: hypothetical protein GYA06_01915 [Chloroflexi bacterium]|jgi:uncharacterized protein YdhG (YjbR/CyaY superfamily)|nr:hypothetical protein [Chloroflexota bacterium]HPO58564.1 DUF1801 domain-containing protein [Anaerolineaceae bacterium]